MNVVILDAGTLPVPVGRPAWATGWVERASTQAGQVVDALLDADIAVSNKVPIGRRDLLRLPRLRYVCVAATGYDCIDVDACAEFGVTVSNVPAYSAQSVSEGVIAAIFALRRSLLEYQFLARSRWPASPCFCIHGTPVLDIAGATLGIIGRGAIGEATARLARAMGMHVMFAEHRGRAEIRDGFHCFDTVLARADVISLHCPLTSETHNLIDATALAAMKPGAILVNSARGGLVDLPSLLAALDAGHLGGAALDVLPDEPPLPAEPVLSGTRQNLLLTPHIGWASTSSVQRLLTGIESNLNAFNLGAPVHVVNGRACIHP